jgi:hypothetical protein
MTTYEFLTQSPKEIGKALKLAGIEKYKDVPNDVKALAKKLNLEPDSRVDYYSTITRGGGTEWYVYFNLDFGFGLQPFDIEFDVNGKCSVTYGRIGGYHTSVKIYKKLCPLFDDRPEYHNLEFSIDGKEYAPYVKDTWDDKEYPDFDDNKPLADYIKIITDKADGYKPFIERVEKACFDGEYEAAYNLYHFNPFVVGHMIITEDPGFSGCVHAMFNAQKSLGTELSLAQLQALYRYLFIHIQEYREYNNDKTGTVEKPLAAFVSELFDTEKLSDEFTPDILKYLLLLADAEGLVNKDKETWDSVYLTANKEFYFACEQLKKDLAEKHGIPADEIDIFNYDDENDTCQPVAMPQSLKERFS